ncbi:helix-turn-helix domain-containing protein [Sphingosinicella soli]|uniref:AraC-like DNA-binding protein n=1 Tax=Sphingosinicella soli TaxID=333708 RepID=A0A7W7B290_9SPHN|nr:helix-turn-helix domain-containing protein [Sphingosinicella soli]MBB4632656.1 AraC-like DNA-binding protein [Sphingosinicella soli]
MYEYTGNAWSTEGYAASERFEAWRQQLNAIYLDWSIEKPGDAAYQASVSTRSFDDFTLVNCRCEPFRASRRAAQMAQDTREIIGVQLVISGRETMDIGGEQVSLSEGDLMIWDNTRPMSFAVQESLHKLSIIMPLSRFKNWLPTSWYTIDKKIAKGSMSGQLLSTFMRNMPDHMFNRENANGDALIEATMGLLVDALDPLRGGSEDQSLKAAQMMRIRGIISEHLSDGELTPHKVAALAKISVRYLHWLFESEGITASQYIISQRLQRCRRELSNPVMGNRTITDIAFSWGFQNSAHFSRRFKQEFGTSPHEFRKMTN